MARKKGDSKEGSKEGSSKADSSKDGSKEQALVAQKEEAHKTSKRPDTKVPEDHPQRLFLLAKEKPATSLEVWFDGGLTRPVRPALGDDEEAHKADDERHLIGVHPLPPGYTGVNKDQMMAIATNPGIQIWPVRFILGDVGGDGEIPWTLYHYTNKDGFDDMIKSFLEAQEKFVTFHIKDEAEKAQEITRALLKELNDEHEERNPKPTPLNPRGDPEMMLVEPGKFATTEEAIKGIYGNHGVSRRTRGGVTFDLLADYVIAFQVPASACFPIPPHADGAVGTVRVCRDTLEVLRKRCQQKRDAERQAVKLERIKKAKKHLQHQHHHMASNICGCFGGGNLPELDEEEHEQTAGRQDHQAKYGDDCVVRDKRELEQAQQMSQNMWVRGHYENCQRKLEATEKQKAEEQKKLDEKNAKKRARQEALEAAQEYKNAVVMNRGARAYKRKPKAGTEKGLDYYIKALIGIRTYDKVLEITSRRKKELGQVLYERYRDREEAQKEMRKPALARIKLGKENADAYFAEKRAEEAEDEEEEYVPEED